MTVNELYRYFLSELETIYPKSEAAGISLMAFESVTHLSRADIIKDPKKRLDEKAISTLHEFLSQLKLHKPVQYLTGEAWFYKMKLKVTEAVLIPRPETEELAGSVISYAKENPDAAILDIGTGSGCIAIAIKKNLPTADVTAIDISNEALAIAKQNAVIQQTGIQFLQLDFLNENNWQQLSSFDIIVSNPPYIPENEKQLLDKNVAEFEPAQALFVEKDKPLIFYEKIAAFGKIHLKAKGRIFLETHEDFAEQTASLFNDGYYSSEIKRDIFGKQRMVIATHHYR